MISLVLEENELDSYITKEVLGPEGDEPKALHKNKLVIAKRIISDSIKDHLIPHVSSIKTPKAMFDALTKLLEGKNINQKMTMRNQLKNHPWIFCCMVHHPLQHDHDVFFCSPSSYESGPCS